MRLLFDTHAFLWWDDQREKLPQTVLAACENPNNTLFLSVVSIWEMQIKAQLGKLKFSMPLQEKVTAQLEKNNVQILAVYPQHIYQIDDLQLHHRDPFDRLLIGQALVEKLFLITHDAEIQKYPVDIFWD